MSQARSLLLVGLLALVGCGALDGPTTPGTSLRLSETELSLYQGTTRVVAAENATGAITWSSADSLIAAVDPDGRVRAKTPGETRVRASSGSKSASVRVVVKEDYMAPVIGNVTLDPATPDLSGGARSLTVSVPVNDTKSGVWFVKILLVPPVLVPSFECDAARPSPQSPWTCTAVLNPYMKAGDWHVDIIAADSARNGARRMQSARFTVTGSRADTTPPALRAIRAPAPLHINEDGHAVFAPVFEVEDTESGIAAAEARLKPLYSNVTTACFARPPLAATTRVDAPCPVTAPANEAAGEWEITFVILWDFAGNGRTYTLEQLRDAGLPFRFTVR